MYPIKFHYKEKSFSCGPCALRMIIESFLNIEIEEEIIINLIGATEEEGTPLALFKKNLSFLLEQICLQINRVNQFTFHIKENSNFNEMQTFQKAGYLIMLNYKKPDGQSHWAVLYQINKDIIYLMDPDFGPYHQTKLNEFNWTGGIKNSTYQAFIAIKHQSS